MIFHEFYSVYYNTVAKIITAALTGHPSEAELQQIVTEHAFNESVITILPALKSGKWQLLNRDLSPVLQHIPTMPLTIVEKRWLKSILDDPRIRLFDVQFPDLEDVQPLFTREDYRIYDQYADGDPFEDETYIKNFRLMLEAIKQSRPVEITLQNRHGKIQWFRLQPKGFEYSVKDDKIRVIATGSRYPQFNMGKILSCRYYEGNGPWWFKPKAERQQDVTLLITNERNALERVMLHFAHFEKQAERLPDGRYQLRIRYYENDETEIVIRVLSFGPLVQVIEPQSFVELMKERLISQKSCELK